MAKQVRYLVEHIIEVRFLPIIGFLDRKAIIGEYLSDKLNMPHFSISMDRFDLWSSDRNVQLFVSNKNYGLVVLAPPTRNFFTDNIKSFLNALKEDIFEFKFRPLVRIGVKSKFLYPWNNTFENLLKKFENNFFNLSPDALKCFNRKVYDIGAFWDLKGKDNSMMATRSGPMKKEQAEGIFDKNIKSKIPEIGLYFEADTSIVGEQPHNIQDIIEFSNDWSSEQIRIFEDIVKLNLG